MPNKASPERRSCGSDPTRVVPTLFRAARRKSGARAAKERRQSNAKDLPARGAQAPLAAPPRAAADRNNSTSGEVSKHLRNIPQRPGGDGTGRETFREHEYAELRLCRLKSHAEAVWSWRQLLGLPRGLGVGCGDLVYRASYRHEVWREGCSNTQPKTAQASDLDTRSRSHGPSIITAAWLPGL